MLLGVKNSPPFCPSVRVQNRCMGDPAGTRAARRANSEQTGRNPIRENQTTGKNQREINDEINGRNNEATTHTSTTLRN
jgi:hypothetical protein